ncbi:MAG: hypothetical protein ABI569_09580 [Casimicrobiaceae bacterium]
MNLRQIAIGVAAAGLAAAFVPVAHAQLNRTAVSVIGNDVNNCAVVTPCRSFARAVSQTIPGGEVVALDSAGFGPFIADRSITVQAAPGVYAGITASAGSAVEIAAGASDKIVLRGLTINGLGTASAGIAFIGGGAEVQVENCLITGFVNWGILSYFAIRVQDTIVRESDIGIQIDNAGAAVNATLERVQVQNSATFAVFSWRNARVAVRDSVATLSGVGFRAADSGVLNIENSLATENTTGVSAATLFSGGGTVRISNTMVVNNSSTGVDVGTGTVETWTNNRIRGNATNLSGSLTTVPAM